MMIICLSSCLVRIIITFLFSTSNILFAFAPPPSHLCRPDQMVALMEFKNEFYINKFADKYNYLKTESWKDNVDCCSWDGITCDSASGLVIELDLSSSHLNGPLRSDTSLFKLQHLQTLDLSENNLFGLIPSSLGNLSYITVLYLSSNHFTGEVPFSIGNLNKLTDLDLKKNNLGGDFPLQVFNLTELSYVDLSYNQFTGQLPSNMSKLSKLMYFYASSNSFSGILPSSLFTIPSLDSLDFNENQLSGPLEIGIVSSPSNLHYLELGENNFHGPIPRSISKLTSLEVLDLSFYNTGGRMVDFNIFSQLKALNGLVISYLNTRSMVELSIFSRLESLSLLDISGNNINISSTMSHPRQFDTLIMSDCNIGEFPTFLKEYGKLTFLDLSYNKIQGRVPEWLWALPMLLVVNISHNSIDAFEGSLEVLRGTNIQMLDISSNAFHGPLPQLPSSTMYLLSSTNYFSGEIPHWICNLTNLLILDLSNNNFSGSIPRCFKNLKSTLRVLHLQNNNLSGNLPQASLDGFKLISLNLGHNRFVGALPKSLSNCKSLQLLNVEHNKINDTFPFWLESLHELRVLVLRSNDFYGPLYSPKASSGFPLLRMIDISQNHFSGTLPPNYFRTWSAMSMITKIEHSIQLYIPIPYRKYFQDSVVLRNKGLEMELVGSSFTMYMGIDFSGNRLEGVIPESIGLLKEIKVLNFSNNAFTGHLPPSLANLTNLESLDLSQNKISGSIPPELGRLSTLSFINLSHNKLVGPIPQGTQFQTQPCSAFSDNIGLYGLPLGQSCGGVYTWTPPKQQETQEPQEEEEVISWVAVGIGIVPGLVFGWTIGYIVASYKNEWFMKISGQRRRGRSAIC